MLQTFELTDQTVRDQLKEQGLEHKIACKKGCSICCKNAKFPILEAEIETIGWHIKNRVSREIRRKIMKKVDKQKESSKNCPFVMDNSCYIYPVRPLACRTYLVLNKACQPGENIMENRFEDYVRLDAPPMQAALHPLVSLLDKDVSQMSVFDLRYQEMMQLVLSRQRNLSEMDWKGFLPFYLNQK